MGYHTIIVKFRAKAGREKDFKEFLESIIPIALESFGCIRHDLHQSLENRGEFLFYENWACQKDHENHINRPEVQEWRSMLNSFLEKPYEVSLWEII